MSEDNHDRRITAAQEAERPVSRGRRPTTRPRTPPALYYSAARLNPAGPGYRWEVRHDATSNLVDFGLCGDLLTAEWMGEEVARALEADAYRAQLRTMHRRAQRAESEAATWRRRAIRGENGAVWWKNQWMESEEARTNPALRLVSIDLVAERDAALRRVRELEALESARSAAFDFAAEWEAALARADAARPAPSWRNLWGRW